MIRKAVGTVIRRITVTATTNRTIGRLAARMSTTVGPRMAIAATATTVPTISNGTTVKMTLPGKVSRFQDLPTTVMSSCLARAGLCRRSLVDAAHDRVEARHDRHRVGDQVARHHQANGLEVDERRVVDAHA